MIRQTATVIVMIVAAVRAAPLAFSMEPFRMFEMCAPPADLARHVRCLRAVHRHASPAGAVERVVPDGCCELVVHFGDGFRSVTPDGATQSQPVALLHGQLSRWLLLVPGAIADMVAVRFTPAGVFGLLGIPPAALSRSAVDLHAVFGPVAATLVERLHEADGLRARWQLLTQFLRGRHRRADRTPWLPRATQWLAHPLARVEVVAEKCEVSRRTLERVFQRAVHLEPKQYQQLCVIAAAADRLRDGQSVDAVASASGHVDASHFARTFKRIVGATPGDVRRAGRSEVALVPSLAGAA